MLTPDANPTALRGHGNHALPITLVRVPVLYGLIGSECEFLMVGCASHGHAKPWAWHPAPDERLPMGETSVYYVPENQDAWHGRGKEVADKVWNLGVFVAMPHILQRLRMLRDAGQPLPHCDLDIYQKFGEIGVADELHDQPVPNYVYDIKCPSCAADVMDATYEAWGADSETSARECPVTCPACGTIHAAKDLRFGEPISFARFYVFVSDCDREEWDPDFRKALEGIVGPCREYWEWST
jgi:hypothetical protein